MGLKFHIKSITIGYPLQGKLIIIIGSKTNVNFDIKTLICQKLLDLSIGHYTQKVFNSKIHSKNVILYMVFH